MELCPGRLHPELAAPSRLRAQAHLKSPQQMWQTFGQLPAALEATVEIAERCQFRLPLRRSKLAAEREEPLGPDLLFGLEPARGVGAQQLTELVEHALPARFADTGRGEPPEAVLELVRQEPRTAGRQFATTRRLEPGRCGQGVQPSVSTTTTSGRGQLPSAASSPNHATAADELDQSPLEPPSTVPTRSPASPLDVAAWRSSCFISAGPICL
jgi:hypothetical protein